ncbi:hypothetical protein [Streptomyces sp. NPDC006552]|uniref:hypothetical protein n=1 Tax=Streptomyces sp. NPDC006552 TaxID=3157179 RepID=UPI0033B885A9
MSILPLVRRPLRPTVLTLALAAGLCLASPGVAAAAADPTANEGAAALSSPSWDQEQVRFAEDRVVYTASASGFDDTGAAYFEQAVVTVGGPEGASYSVTHAHS